VPDLFLRFVMLVVDKRRQRLLGDIAAEYRALVDQQMGRVRVQVSISHEPDEALRGEIARALAARLGRTVVPTFTVDPSLLGGMVVRYGEEILDGSVRTAAENLRRRLMAAAIAAPEEMPPGNRIPTHKHLQEDEVIFVHKGTVHISLAGREYDAAMGATVFIPHGNWIGVENTSREPAMILFFFNKPAFERCLRAMSSRPGEKFTMPPPESMATVREQCHEVMKD